MVELIRLKDPSTSAMMQAQIDLHAALDGREIDGWRISFPRPLYVCKSPAAIVMSSAPGQSISLYTSESDVPTSQIMPEAARIFAMAMEYYWSSGRLHGDLNLGNVLYDLAVKTISLIDPGTRADCRICSDVTKFQSGVVCDLAHLLWEVSHDCKKPQLSMPLAGDGMNEIRVVDVAISRYSAMSRSSSVHLKEKSLRDE